MCIYYHTSNIAMPYFSTIKIISHTLLSVYASAGGLATVRLAPAADAVATVVAVAAI